MTGILLWIGVIVLGLPDGQELILGSSAKLDSLAACLASLDGDGRRAALSLALPIKEAYCMPVTAGRAVTLDATGAI